MEPHTDWTIATLKEHFEAILIERDLRYQQRFEASQSALAAALQAAKEMVALALAAADRAAQVLAIASEKRFEGQNEFRGAMGDAAGRLATKEAVDAMFAGLTKEIASLTMVIATMQGSNKGLSSGWGYLAGAGGLALAVYTTFIK
jgi:hypothetical protein